MATNTYLVLANMHSEIFSDSDGVSEARVLSLGATVKVAPSRGVPLSSDGSYISSHILHWMFCSVMLHSYVLGRVLRSSS
jgi:hypothetical protein